MKASRITTAMVAALALSTAKAVSPLDEHDGGLYMMQIPGCSSAMLRISLSDHPDPNKKRDFWTKLRNAPSGSPVLRTVWQLHFRKPVDWKYKLPPFDVAKQQIDAWFGNADGIDVDVGRIFAVTPEEENISWHGQMELMNQIGDYLRETYGLSVYQWLSEPLEPRLGIRADGWVMDAYSVPTERFHAHLEKFILYGKPTVPILWASGHFDTYFPDKTEDELIAFSKTRMDYCRALGLPVFLFGVTLEPYGSVSAWYNTNKGQPYRDFFVNYLEAMPSTPKPEITPPPKYVSLPLQPDGQGIVRIDGKAFSVANTTVFEDPHVWRVTEDGLRLRSGQRGRLTWTLKPESPLATLAVEISYHANGTARVEASDGTAVELARGNNKKTTLIFNTETTCVTLIAEGDFCLQEVCFTFSDAPDAQES